LAFDRLSIRFALVVLIAAALGLSACGRKGALDPPPNASAPPPPPAASAADASGAPATANPAAPPAATQKKSFILDPLLQ
jgi:predicted small lipoprotein YifL